MLNQEFKKKCLQAFQYSQYLNDIINGCTNNNLDQLRNLFDLATDELQKEINQTIGPGEESIHNARVHQLKSMFTCLNELYDIYEVRDVTESELLRS